MKTFEQPEVNVINFTVADIITVSSETETLPLVGPNCI